MHLLILLLSVYSSHVLAGTGQIYSPEDAAFYFEEFIKKFDKQYADDVEKQSRFEIFKENLENINLSNNASGHAVFGVTQFSDLTHEEFIERFTGIKPGFEQFMACDYIVHDADIPDEAVPEAFDWRSSNVVSPVKNQLQCGSCYAFSTIGHLESQYAIKHGQILDLSEQQIVDCDTNSNGCGGGWMSVAMRALISLGGSMLESDYAYQNQKGTCASDPNKGYVKLSTCYSYELTSQEKLKQLLYRNGPVAVVIQASVLKNYQGGIVSDSSCVGGLDHAVLLVGYGSENGIPYWIVKNSWGESFGESGFFRLQRGGNQYGACGILNVMMATAVIQ